MNTFLRFLYEFLSQFFNGIKYIVLGIFNGFKAIFNIPEYIKVVNEYKGDLSMPEWILVGIAILVTLIMLSLIGLAIYFLVRKYIKIRKSLVEQESLLEEVGTLNNEVAKLVQEKETILAMKVSQLGLKPGESATEETENTGDESVVDPNTEIRFPKLYEVDQKFKGYKIQDYGNSYELPEFVELFRNFAASQLKLYYTTDMIRLFVSALASTKLVILQGIAGTGKTSLAYAFLDEMNISRVEYYFAEMLSILEMPNKDEWIVEIVPSSWKSDPIHLIEGKLKIPPNMWYIGTINNDDSTFMVTDKVYDRAMPIDINDKGQVFEPENIPAQDINFSYLDGKFQDAIKNNPIHEENLKKIEEMDDYVIQHFRIAFGNRIVAHMKKFVPVFVACGGDEIRGIDYFIARKILRKFEQLNIAYIRDEIDGFVKFLNDNFGEGKMSECIEYLLRLKKMA